MKRILYRGYWRDAGRYHRDASGPSSSTSNIRNHFFPSLNLPSQPSSFDHPPSTFVSNSQVIVSLWFTISLSLWCPGFIRVHICITKKKNYNLLRNFEVFFYRLQFNLIIGIPLQESKLCSNSNIINSTTIVELLSIYIYKISKDDKWSEDIRIEPTKRTIEW